MIILKLFKNNTDKINMEEVNEVVSLSKKILHLFYIAMIIAMVLIITIIAREWGVWKFLFSLLSVLAPFFIGFVIAWLLNPVVTKLENKKIPRALGAIIVYTVFLLAAIILIRFLIPTIYTQIEALIKNLPSIFNELENIINNLFNRLNGFEAFDFNATKNGILTTITNSVNNFFTSLPTMLVNFVGTFFSSLVTITFGLVIGIYILIDFNSINGHLLKLVPKKNRFEMSLLITNISTEVRKTVNGTFLVALMVFVCDSFGFWVIGLQGPLLFGLLCGITDLIPYIGPYIGGIIAALIGFSQGPIVGVMTIIVAFIVQMLENNILQPIIMSKTTKLHPVTIIVGLLIFEHFFGIIGMILATPCIALVKVVWRFFKEKYNLFHDNDMVTEELGK